MSKGNSIQVFKEYNLTMVEKETVKVFLNATFNGDRIIILSAQDVANKLSLSRPRAYAILLKLVDKEVLEKIKGKGFVLTSKGEILIHELNHREKILETFFYKELDFPLEKASLEASNLSFYVSTMLINTLCDKIGVPKTCRHGIPINHDLSTHS